MATNGLGAQLQWKIEMSESRTTPAGPTDLAAEVGIRWSGV